MKHFDKIFDKLAELHISLAFIKSYIIFSDVKLLKQQVDSLDISTSEAKFEALLSLKFS